MADTPPPDDAEEAPPPDDDPGPSPHPLRAHDVPALIPKTIA